MQKTNFKRILSFLTAVSMVMSMVILPAAAEEGTEHTHEYTQETIVAEATCGIAGSKKLSCTCGDFIEEGIPATGEHNYEQGVCTVCETEKPCTGTAECDALTHTSCLSQCKLDASCTNDVHKAGCPKNPHCTCIQACSENLACPVCQDNGTCTGAIAAENIARVQALIDALPASYNLSQEAQMKAQYDACTAAINGLQEHERAALNLTKYTAAATPTIIDNVNVAFIGQTGYPTLEAAIAASLENSVISLKAGTYTLPAALTKDLKIQALDGVQVKDVIIKMGTPSNTVSAANKNVSFTGVTLNNSSAMGFQGAASETYANCIIQGQYWAFAKNAVFSGCTFETTSTTSHNIQTHRAETISFTNCTFNCAGKSVKIYNEGTNGTNATFSGCTFKASPEIQGAAAIEIDSSLLDSQAKNRIFTVSISGQTVTGFVANETVTNPLWTNNGDLTEVTVNSSKELTIKHNADTLPVLVNVKDSIDLQNDVTLSETLTISKPVTINLNGKTITNDVASGSLFLVNKSLTILDTASGSSIKSSENSAGILLTNEGSAYLTSGSFDGKVISNGEKAVVSISGGTYSNFAAEMTDGGLIVIGGGTFKTDDTVTDVSAYTFPGYAQNSETGTVSQQDVPSSGVKAVSTVDNSSNNEVIGAAVSKVEANTALEINTGLDALYSSSNLNDAAKVLKQHNTGTNIYGTTIRTTVKVTLTQVQTNSDGSKVTGLSFTAEPQIQAVRDNAVVATAPISNETIGNKTITFRIPIVGTSAGKLVNLTHKTQNMGTYAVQGTGDNLYIEIKTSSFSPWSVTILAEDAKNVAKVGSVNFADIDSALSYLQENGGKLELLENVTTAAVLTLPAEKTAEIALSGKTYTYTGTASAFVNNGTKLVLGGGTVSATAGGTLAQSSAGTLEISGINFTSTTTSGETTTPSTTGNTITITGGTATIKSGSFSGNASSLSVTSGSATITGGTFGSPVTGAVTIQGGTYNASVTTTVPINGVVANAENPARFKNAPAETMIVEKCSAVKIGDYYVIRRNPHVLVKKGSAAETPIYYDLGEDFDDILAEYAPATFTLTRDEVVGSNHTLSGDSETIIEFAGNKITGTGSLIAGSKSLFMKGMGNGLVDAELGTGDKAIFTSNGTVNITAAENKSGSTSYGYGEVKLSLKVDDKTVSSVYFLGTDATLKVGTNGAISTTGQIITQLTADANGKPTYVIHTVSDGTDLTNNFVMKSSDKLVFTSNGFYEGFSKVTVNGKDLSTSNYTKEKGSTIITLKNTYLKTLTKGKYELKIHYKDGKTAAANFYVVEAAKATTTPKTGDPIMTAVFGMNASAAALGAMLFLGKKKKK